ncbi:MAG: sortase B protein-sorting domain-containing protein [Lachnospiraceae bacterium]
MKILKNKLTIALSIFLCLAMFLGNGMVSYAAGKTVTITSVSGTTTTVTVAGTTDAAAVMVQIRDASGTTILAMQSFGTLNDEFSGSITGLSLTAGTEYTVYIADYEGGPWATQTVTPVQAASGGESGSGESGTTPSVSPSPSVTPSATQGDQTPSPSPSPTPGGEPGDNANPDESGNSASPQTGDTANMALWFVLMIAGGVSVVFLQRAIKKQTKVYKKK